MKENVIRMAELRRLTRPLTMVEDEELNAIQRGLERAGVMKITANGNPMFF